MKLSNRLKIGIIGVVVTIIALYFIASQLNIELFLEAWATAKYLYVAPAIFFLFIGIVTRAFRWRVLLDNKLPLLHTFHIMNVAYLVNGVLPLRIGEVARVYLVSRTESAIPIPTTTGTIIVERLLDLLAVVVMVLLALMLGPVPAQIRLASGISAIAAIVGFVILVILASRREWALKLFSGVLKRIPILNRYTVLEEWFGQFLTGLVPITQPGALFSAFSWTAISWLLSTLSGYVLMFAFFDSASVAASLLFIAAVAFAIALPAVPGNIGTYEASILLALNTMGYVQPNTTIAFAVMVHAVNIFVQVILGIIGFIQEGISLGQLSQGVRQMQQNSTETG